MSIRYIITGVIATVILLSCKNEFLDKKPSTAIVQPESLDDFQKLLDNSDMTNSLALNILAGDEYTFKNYELWQGAYTDVERNSYIWTKDLYGSEQTSPDWNLPYKAIFYANNVLAGLERVTITSLNANRWNMTKGWALFIRANAYHDLVRHYATAYDASTAKTDMGVPLRLDPSIGTILPRASVQETYDRILTDLQDAVKLLDPLPAANNRSRPSKVAAYALMARVYLNMRDYTNAEASADNSLKIYDKLLDYNSLSQTSTTPFPSPNDEILYFTQGFAPYFPYLSTTVNTFTVIAQDLINLYQPGDLRLPILFIKQADGTYVVKRNISGITLRQPFTGLATDEVYLIKAEAAARRSDFSAAMDYLNRLLIKRFLTNQFTPVAATSGADALAKVLLERRKELVYRSLRWDDLKRLNKEGANITLQRNLNGEIFTLEPNSPRYVFPIPNAEITLSGITQNPR